MSHESPSSPARPVEPGSSEPAQDPSRTSRRWPIVKVALFLLAAAGASAWATWQLKHWENDGTALDRPWINAPFITTPMDVVNEMVKAADVKESDLLYDLGCGDGRIAIVAAEKTGCRSMGFDIEAARIEESRANAKTRGVEDRTAFELRDVFTLDFHDVDVVAFYLLPRYMQKLMPQFQQLRPGARVVAHDFGIDGVKPDREIHFTSAEDQQMHRIFVYIAPINPPPAKE